MEQWRSPHGRPLPRIGERTLVMGILNVTPDSFSDGGQLCDLSAVVDRAARMIAAGADVLDIGGESTRPGAAPVSAGEEQARVLPAIQTLRQRWPDVALSVDTFKPKVAEAAVVAGADIINDIWGLAQELGAGERRGALAAVRAGNLAALPPSRMAAVAAQLGCPVILMHNRPDRNYADFWPDLMADLQLSLALAGRAGIARHQIWLDPGFGFAKSAGQNLEVVKHLDRIVALGFPVLAATSRKSTIGKVLGTTTDERVEGTAATMVWSIERGCAMIRVHDVPEMVRVARMTDAIKAGAAFRFPDATG